ncbi:homeobox protein Nkx-6.3-like isoform X2 [Engraulis encrasicolus]|uniref:homeobox protein Nkx-6.3-like isoform X2 n=1 Tax=Engraulis encrasicolus TaxID=184585 RepID=UPI002FD2212E
MDHPDSAPSFLHGAMHGGSFPQRHHYQSSPSCPLASHSSLNRANRPPQGDAHWPNGGPTTTTSSAPFLLLHHPGPRHAQLLAGLCATTSSGLDANGGGGDTTGASCQQVGGPGLGLSAALKEGLLLRTQGMGGREEDPGLRMEEAQQIRTATGASKLHKKKHSRPTFSGYQIFVLEKSFEQNKYLSSTEKKQLARSLGMAESQVWFQNRRTKWRRTSAAPGSDPEGRTARARVTPAAAQVRPLPDGEDDNKPLDPNRDDDRVQRLLRRHGQSHHSPPGEMSVLQMEKAFTTHFSHCKDV